MQKSVKVKSKRKQYGKKPTSFLKAYKKACSSRNSYTHTQAIKDLKISRGTYYKYVAELKGTTRPQKQVEVKLNLFQKIKKFFEI